MKRTSLRHFTTHVQEYAEPVEVFLQIKGSGEIAVLGTWQPEEGVSRPPVETEKAAPAGGEDLVEEIRQLKRQLAARPENERQLLAQRDAALEEAHLLRRKIEGVAVTKPASNVRAKAAPTQVRVGTASFNSRPFTPVPKS